MKNKRKVVICAIARMENQYINDWVRHHLAVGFDHIYLYDNYHGSEERIKDIIDSEFFDRVTIIEVPDKSFIQSKCYNDCYKERNFDWMAFIDLDEYITLVPRKFKDIHELVEQYSADEILLNWRFYDDSDLLDCDGRPVDERFCRSLPGAFSPYNMFGSLSYCRHVKQILRKGLNIKQVGIHATEIENVIICVDGDGKRVKAEPLLPYYTFSSCYIKHFFTKTITEYIDKKSKRTGGATPGTHYDLADFFLYNRPTLEKIKIYRSAKVKHQRSQTTKSLKWWIKCWIKMWIIVPILNIKELLARQ